MTYIPKPDNKAKHLSLLCIVTGFVIMALSIVLPYSALFQLVALGAICAGAFLLNRYVLCEYRYIIDDKADGSSDFIVYRKQGKNDVKVCHISLLGVEDIYPNTAKKSKGALRYAYNRNLTDKCYTLVLTEENKRLEITIEADETFLSLIRERIGGGGSVGAFAM